MRLRRREVRRCLSENFAGANREIVKTRYCIAAVLAGALALVLCWVAFSLGSRRADERHRMWRGELDEASIRRVLEGRLIGAALLFYASSNDFRLPSVLAALQPSLIGTNVDLAKWTLAAPQARVTLPTDLRIIAYESALDKESRCVMIHANGNARLGRD